MRYKLASLIDQSYAEITKNKFFGKILNFCSLFLIAVWKKKKFCGFDMLLFNAELEVPFCQIF